jgi:ankyrin repeat protein
MKNMSIFSQLARITAFVFIVSMLTAAGLRAGEIHNAAAAGDLNKVRALIEADPTLLESKSDKGDTPLIAACKTLQVAVANYLIDKGANVNAKGEFGGTPLSCTKKDKDECFDLVQRLVAKGADVNAANQFNWTVLCDAAASGNTKVTKFLIDHGADLNFRWSAGTLLQMAITLGPKEEMAKLLVESGAKLQPFGLGNTELHLAAMKGLADLVPPLVKHGAGVNAVNEYNHTALYYAAKHGHRKAADALIAAGAKKSAIAETNYGKASQLTAMLKEGEAYLWYLGGDSPCDGYAVKTKNHMLIFNPSGISESPEAGLANGYLNPNELAGQKITVLINHRLGPYGPSVSDLAKAMPGADFVLNFKPTADNAGNSGIPPYRLATPNESFSMGGIQLHTIPAMLQVFFEREGLGYLVEADGVKIFHSGLHVSGNETSQMEKYRKEIDFLKPFGPIDIAILPIKGRHIQPAYEPYLYLLDQLSPRAVYLIGDDFATDEHKKCVEVLRARNIPVAYPEGGIAVGERFHFLRNSTQK